MSPLPRPPCTTARVLRPLPDRLDPTDAFERLRGFRAPWLLESGLTLPGAARFSFVGADPYLVLRARGDAVEVECHRAVYSGLPAGVVRERASILDALRALMPPAPEGSAPHPFSGGAVGALGYETAEQFDVHRLSGVDDLGLPDAVWLFVDAVLAIDHDRETAVVTGLGFDDDPEVARAAADRAADTLCARLAEPADVALHRVDGAANDADRTWSELDTGAYLKAVDEIAEEIAAGEIYQACLTYRVDQPYAGDPWQLYRALRQRDPAPFAAYFELPEVCIAGSSPERFLRVGADRSVESRPIKGTAPRGRDDAEDARNQAALAASEKDRAENLMIVDLLRNDLGRVCATGSVSVPRLFAIEPYAAVFQLVSTVRGTLRDDCDALDAIAATFPPGSMTGAPKIAAMRVLDRLETVRRGFYSGAIGYLDVGGGADLSVVIRTAFVKDGTAYLHAGGGIVADSQPEAELEEARAKLRSLLAALETATRESGC